MQEKYFPQIILVITFTALPFLATNIPISIVEKNIQAIFFGIKVLAPEITSPILSSYPLLPIIVFWLLLGVLAYFFYYSLRLIYSEFFNFLLIEGTYKKAKPEKPSYKKIVKRILFHLLIIAFYLLLIITTFLFPLPFSETLRFTFEKIIKNFNMPFSFALSFLAPLAYWSVLISVAGFVFKKITAITKEEEIKEEHFPKNN